ncbi:carboxypeptidase-like regulatory domain-containing protein [Tenacibaculum sp. S7007]|uniref:Carboxypeptidase-like regulatory domain-containing protein n=1 Tax=Tenacibaculum pelagium TaxID=2759527 RepID=A0A839AKX3_9FLAO|nr:carboxypeptidase-like regulatory domain-containing protein [Tenacibaculum pelagium]MBA6155725.1 carboxypeptidase-like regulatory domain-containing protein [Tenacibaculum pelagium]
MKKELILFLFAITFTLTTLSQISVKGKITSINNQSLEGASVYFNNTTIGTITDSKGYFELNAPNSNYKMIISYLGFKTKQVSIKSSNEFLTIKLEEDTTLLNEVVLSKTKYDENWKYNLARFKQSFLGRSKLAQECKILNEKDLHFDYNAKTNTLTAFAKEPLKIKHNGLGYLIIYDLVDFTIKDKQLFFSGYAQYKNLKKSVRKKWKQNRLDAYNGSQMHFLRSLIDKEIKQEGFVVNQFKRVLNPERPSEEKIKLAKELVKLYGNNIDFSRQIASPKTTLDSALVTLKKSRKPKYRNYLYKRNVLYKDMISFENELHFFNFKNYLMVIYTKEPEEENYVMGLFGKKREPLKVQTSNIVLLNGKSIIDKTGVLAPDSFFNEGYWAFEAFANMLPLDYQPLKN